MWQAVLCSMHGRGAATTLVTGDLPLFLAALRPVHPHVYELGAFASRALLDHRFEFLRQIRREFDYQFADRDWHRIQMTVRVDAPGALKMARWLGFEREGLMHNYGPDGSHYWRMAKCRGSSFLRSAPLRAVG